jgi:hypothetical protein
MEKVQQQKSKDIIKNNPIVSGGTVSQLMINTPLMQEQATVQKSAFGSVVQREGADDFDFMAEVFADQRAVLGTGIDFAEAGGASMGSAGRILAPLGILANGYQTVRGAQQTLNATNNLDRIGHGTDTAFAGAGTAAGLMTLFGAGSATVGGVAVAPVLGAASAGYGIGRSIDNATDGRISDNVATGMTIADQAISSILPSNPNQPEYRNQNRIAWALIDAFNL